MLILLYSEPRRMSIKEVINIGFDLLCSSGGCQLAPSVTVVEGRGTVWALPSDLGLSSVTIYTDLVSFL